MQDRKIREGIENIFSYTRQKRKEYFIVRLQELGIKTSSRGAVIHAIYGHEGLVQDEISATLSMDKAFVTRELNALFEAGIIRREKDTRDHRKNHIYLTEEGRKLGKSIRGILDRWDAIAYDGISTAEMKTVHGMLERVKKNIIR